MTLDPTMTRRGLLLTSTAVGAGLLAACTSPPQQNGAAPAAPAPGTTSSAASGVRAQGERYGVGVYNTEEVADELRWIAENVQPGGGEAKRILVTGSTGGIGQLAAAHLLQRGHRVVAHARNEQRGADVRRDLPGLENVVVGDLRDLDQTRTLADDINGLGAFDVIIHNAGEYGLADSELLRANSLSPYLLTALVTPPQQLIYLSSDQHLSGALELDEVRSGGGVTYSDTKLHMAMIATAAARLWPSRQVNAVAPGWIATVMGFANGNTTVPDSLRDGYLTQVWLAEGVEPGSDVTGEFLFHRQVETRINDLVHDADAQDELLAAFASQTGVTLPAG